jgi:hypothetical protein
MEQIELKRRKQATYNWILLGKDGHLVNLSFRGLDNLLYSLYKSHTQAYKKQTKTSTANWPCGEMGRWEGTLDIKSLADWYSFTGRYLLEEIIHAPLYIHTRLPTFRISMSI